MKRWLTHLVIGGYLSALGWGLFAHTFAFGTGSHPLMYYVVWDMFCGWAAYETRFHLIAEGESGTFYQLAPAPWGDVTPYGEISRHHYDSLSQVNHKMALNTLAHTDHEPILRFMIVEECWQKKYNLPESTWKLRFEEPKEPYSYFNLVAEYTPQGRLLATNPSWWSQQYHRMLMNNPRLQADSHRGRPFYAVNPGLRDFGQPVGPTQELGSGREPQGPLGN